VFEVSTRWQDGAASGLAYVVIILGILWVLSKIQIKDKEEGNQ
jgi:hypothetical protein